MSGSSRSAPPAASTVRAAFEDYLAANGFDVGAYDAPTYEVDMGEVTGDVWTFPNTPARKRAVPFHDLHHVATGYGTDVVGEAEIGAWEIVAGCNSVFLWWIDLSAIALGLLVSPRRTWTALRTARGQRTLYRESLLYADALELTVGELRARLGIPPEGQAAYPARLHRLAPGSRDAPDFTLASPIRSLLRLVSGGVNPLLGGVRAVPRRPSRTL